MGRDLISVGFQIAVVVGGPLLLAAYAGDILDRRFGTTPYLGLAAILLGLGVAAAGAFLVIRRYARLNPAAPVSDAARKAGERWEAELRERERRKEAGEDDE
jgi:F0F1-type ATP synthase assembly protein I